MPLERGGPNERDVPDERDVPTWALGLLQNLARYVFGTGNRFAPGHKLGLDGPIAPGETTALSAVLFVEEPELPPIASPRGGSTPVR